MGILDELKKQFQQSQQSAQQPQQPAQQRRLNTEPAQKPQPTQQMTALTAAINKWASKGTVVKDMPARRKLMFEPEPPKNWYSGETPTNSEILARIATISETNPAQSKELFNQYQAFANDPTSPLYNPYKTSTNKAITELQNLGFDMSGGVTDKWINDNAWLMQYYRTETGNTPLAPTKKSSVEQNAAYWYYKILSAEETTQKAETEWQALQDEIKYWVGRTDRNYSDDEILKKIDWSNYKTLTGMDEGTAKGVPTTLNRAVGYSTDALKGVIWAARNGSTGDPTLDSVNAVLGKGKTWTKDPNVAAKLDPTSSKYSPYSVGSTLDDAALYFGVQEFSKNWLDANRAMISSDDVTEQKMYQKVYTAEQNTLKAEAELDELNKFVDAQLKYVKDPAMLAQQINDFVDDNCKTLAKMDESRKSGNIMATTRAVDYRIEDIRADAIKRMNEANGKIGGGDFVQKLAQNFKTNIKAMASDSAIQRWRNAAVSAAAETIMALGTDEEKIAFQNGGTAEYMNFLQQIAWSMHSENPDGQAIVNDALESADTYVKENYMDAYSVVHQYDEAQQELENIQQRINELTNPYAQLPGFKYIGNIDIYNRVPVVNEDGSYSTVDSFSVNIDGREVLLPTIVDGKRVSEDEAIKHYFDTGEHLGIFDTPEEADEYAQKLHEQQERYYTHPDEEEDALSSFRASHPLPGYVIASGGASDAPMFSKDQLKPSETYENWLRYNMDSDAVQDIWNDKTLSEEEMDRRTRELWAQQTGGRENVNVYDDVQLNEMPEEGAPIASDPKNQAELNALYLRQQEQQAIIDRLAAEYDAKSAILKEAQTNYEAAQKYAQVYGIDISDVGTLMQDFEIAWQLGSEYVPTEWRAYTAFDEAEADGMSHEAVTNAAKRGRADCANAIAMIDTLLTRLGVNADDSQEQLISDEFVENINRYRESLERDLNAATYWLMPDEEWFDGAVQTALDEIGDGSKLSWIGKTPLESYVQLTALSIKYPSMNIAAFGDSVIGDEAAAINAMTENEKKTLVALYTAAGADAAQEYLSFMNDPTYGMLITRQTEAKRQENIEWTQKSGWAAAGMNILDVIASPVRLMGTAYAAIAGISGNEINPNSPYFAASTLDSAVTQATTESIEKAWGDNKTMAWLSKLVYESGKSIAESMYTGHLFGGITGNTTGILSDWLGAVPMGAEAVASAVQDAKNNGATNEQALAIGGITFFAESVSEAITIGNLKEALNKGGTEGLKQTFMNTIKNAFTEEAPGEMFNEALETAADYWIMGENSKFNQEVERLVIEEGLSIEQAQDRALVGVVGDVLYAGLSGAVGGMMGGGVEAVAGKHAYNSAVRAIQKQTGLSFNEASKILDAMESARNQATQAEETTAQAEEAPAQETEQRTTPHNEPQAVTADDGTTAETVNTPEAETTEEPVTPSETPAEITEEPVTEAQPETASGSTLAPVDTSRFGQVGGSNSRAANAAAALTASFSADTASQTATIGAALAPEDGQNIAPARTAAQHLAAKLGSSKAVSVMRGIAHATMDGNLNYETVQVSVTTAILNEGGQANATLTNMAENGVTVENLNELINEAAVEAADPEVQAEMEATIRENEIAEHVKSLIADGALNGIRPMEQAVTDAKNKRRAANGALTKQVNKFNAAKQSFQEAQAAWRADPNNKDLKAAKNAARAAMKAQAEVVDEYRQRQANAEQAVTNAEDTLQHARAQAMADLRQQAQAQIAEEQAQAQAVAEQQAQEQAQAEAEAAVQADEQRQQNNAQTLDVDTFIAQAFPDATDEEKQTIRERFEAKRKEMTDPVEIRKRERFVKNLGRKFGVNIQIADTTEGGTRSRYLGSYDEGSNTITLDKGVTQTNAIYAVALHELTHMAERSGLYDQLASALTRIAYRNEDGSFNEAQLANDIRARQALYNNRLSQMGEAELTADQASKEVVADLTRKILFGDEAAINALVAEDEGVARRMLNGIKNFLNKMRGIDDPAVTQLRQTRRLFEKALKDAQKNLGNTGVGQVQYSIDQREGTPVAEHGDDVLVSEFDGGTVAKQYSLASWTEQERATVEKNLIDKGFSKADVEKWINDVDSIAATIAAERSRLDYTADPGKTMLKPNAEYVKTLDASTLCAKRLLYQGTFNAIQHLLPNTPLMPEDLIDLVNMLKEVGYESPCGICYVESRRRHLGKFAQEWLDSYNGEYKPTLDEVTTTDGLEALRKSHPQAYKDFVSAMNKKGTMNPKVVQLRTDYRGEIRSMTKGQKTKVTEIGGLRVQSFSDFETPHLIDMMQAVLDMAAEKLTSQAYTKVPNFAWVFGDTGIKINLSLIGEGNGLDANGNLIFSSSEGMDFDEAMKLRDRYGKNVGTILVGMNDAHILAAMADPRIDFIIPFHKSGWSANELAKVRGMQYYSNYELTQNERRETIDPETGKRSVKTVSENFQPVGPNGYWDFSKSGKENAETYLRMCAEDGRIPKFDQFLVNNGDGSYSLQPDGSTDGYWKTLIDFKMYDNEGVGSPQTPVTPNVNMDEAKRILSEYEGGANTLPVADDIVEEFVEKYKAEHPSTQYSLPSMDILDEQIEQYLSGGYEAFGRSANQTSDINALRGGRTVPENPDTVPQGAPKKSPYQLAIDLADALNIGHHFGTRKMGNSTRKRIPKAVLGYYQTKAEYINVRSTEAGNFLTTMHEIWHGLGKTLGMEGTADMVSKLDSAFHLSYEPYELPGEAFAEFGWNYCMGDAQARDFAGDDFVDNFERAAKRAGVFKAVKQTQKEMQMWLNASIIDKGKATVRDASEANKPHTGIRKLIDNIIDDTSIADEVDAVVRKQTGKTTLSVDESLRKASLMKNFSSKVANSILNNKLVDANGNEIGKSLAARLDEAGVTGKDFDTLVQYWLFKHSRMRDAMGKPVFDIKSFPVEQREAFIQDVELNHPNIVKGEEALQSFRKEFMQAWLVDTNFMEQEDFDLMNTLYPDYAPTKRVMDQAGGGRRGGGRRNFTIYAAKGGTQDIINPFDSYVDMVNSIVNMVRANKAAQTFDKQFKRYDGLGQFAIDVTQDMKIETVNTEALQKRVANILYGKEQTVLTADQTDIIQQVLDAIGTEQSQMKGTGRVNLPNVLTVIRENGERVYYQMSNPELYNLLASQRDNVAGPLLRKVAKLTRAMSALTTGSNPVFALRNFLRDYQNSVNYGSWASNYLTGFPKWLSAAWDVFRKSGDYSDYQALGGGGWNYIDTGTKKGTTEYRGDLIKGYKTRNALGVAKTVGEKLWHTITFERLNEVIEQASRYVEYKYGQHDLSTAEGRQDAFLDSQDVTVDFARTGNGKFAAELKAVIPFFGASVQGVYRTARMFTEAERDRAPARFLKTVINTALTSALCSAFLLRDMDDDDKEAFLNMSDDLKAGHFYIPNFAKGILGQAPLIRIPVAQDPLSYAVHGMMTNLVWKNLSYEKSEDGKGHYKWGGTTDEMATDILSIANTILDNLTPINSTILDPLISMKTNVNWYGGKIVPSRLEDLPATDQFTEETPSMFVNLGRAFGVSPLMLQYAAEQYTGFLGQMAIPAMSYDKNTGEIGGVMAAINAARKKLTSDPLISNDIIGSFYDGATLIDNMKKVADKGLPQNDLRRGLSDEELTKAYEEASAMLKKGGIIYDTKQRITDCYSRIDQINANQTLSDEEKYKLTSDIRREMIGYALDAQEAIGEWKANYVNGRNFVTDALFEGGIAYVPTAYDKMPDTFKADENEEYMQLATEVYEKTGKDSALPHPSNTFKYTPKGGKQTDVTVDDAYWPAFCNQYKTAYVAKLNELIYKSGKDWSDMTDEEQLDILTKAHDKGRDKAKAWYLDYGPKN